MKSSIRLAIALSTVACAAAGVYVASGAAPIGPSTSREAPGPAVGPSGQQGEIHYLSNPATPWNGNAEMYGPYRLLPPGTETLDRSADSVGKPSAERATASTNLHMSALYIAPTLGFTETGLTGTSIGGDIVQIVANWKGPSGSITIAHNALPAYMMPIDVYLYYPDSMLTWVKTKISGKPALIEQPVSGPAPNSGVVRIAIGNNELVLASPDLDQGTLTLLAGRLIDSGSVKEVKQ